ncbi:MAG: AMP-binding protein [Candidatus Gastranaerophilaceae bacterium]
MGYGCLLDIWRKSADDFGDSIAISDVFNTDSISYKVAFKEICYLAEVFKSFGIEKGDKICFFAQNFPHWLLIEQAGISLGSISVSKNSQNSSIKELEYIFYNSDSCALICDSMEIINYFTNLDSNFFNKVKFVLYTGTESYENQNPNIKNFSEILASFDKNKDYFSDYKNDPQDACYIHYTSGTSSLPKGAVLVNYGMVYEVEEIKCRLKNEKPKLFLETFPLASAGGKTFNLYSIAVGCKIVFTPYNVFFEKLKELKPSLLHCAPKIVMTMLGKYNEYIESGGKIFKKFFELNYSISKFILKIQRNIYKNKKTNTKTQGIVALLDATLNVVKKFQDKVIYKKIRNQYIQDSTILAIGSASFANSAEDFYSILGIHVAQDYGMTETTGIATHATLQDQLERPYTVGRPFSKTEFKIVDPETKEVLKPMEKGILMLKGPNVMKGYYNNPEATSKALSEDGWLTTGDLAYLYPDNYLVILSRYDDVIVLMNGYNVFAPPIQDQINSLDYINQTIVVGHGKPYLSALIFLNKDLYEKWCSEQLKQICDPNFNEEFKNFLLEQINIAISQKNHYHYYEKIKNIYFVKEGFSEENGFLTNTLKIKYRKVCEVYQGIIDSLYE